MEVKRQLDSQPDHIVKQCAVEWTEKSTTLIYFNRNAKETI